MSQTNQPIKVAHLITDLDTGGAEVMLARLLSRFDRHRFNSLVISLTDRGSLGDLIETAGFPVHTLGMRPGIPDLTGMARLAGILRRERPVILQTWLYHADLLGLLVGSATRVPALAWNVRCSDMDMRHYALLSRLILLALARLSPLPDAVLVNSEVGRQLHVSLGYKPRRWVFIPNGFDLNRFQPNQAARHILRQELGLPSDALLVGLVARYDPMKDQRTFLEAAQILADKHTRAHFVMVGRGISRDTPDLGATITELQLAGRVHLLGERRDIPAIMAGLDILALSSAFGEGFPNVVGEAMACGVPCVVTDVGDASYVVAETGIVVPPRSPRQMADAWSRLLAMPDEERLGLGKAARQRVEEMFSLGAVVRQYEALYTEIGEAALSR